MTAQMQLTAFLALSADEQAGRLTRLASRALAHWGVRGCTPRLIKYRENAVFEVVDAQGQPAALRVHRQGYHSVANLRSELAWMAMLAANGIIVPAPIATAEGDMTVAVGGADVPGAWQVDMLGWLQGRELGEVGEPLDFEGRDPRALFHEIGRTVGRLHNLTSDWPARTEVVRHAWDRDGLVGEEPLWGRFWELAALQPAQRALLLRARDALAADLSAYARQTDNYGLIHADLVPENIMLDGDRVQLIDFDDAGFGWHMFELATALYWLDDEPAFGDLAAGLLEGYQSVRPLERFDIETLGLFYAARSLTYVGWVHTRSNTEAAVAMTPMIVERAERFCGAYLAARGAPAGTHG